MLVTDENPVEDKLGDGGVGQVPQSILPAHVPHELQTLRVHQGLNQHLPRRLQGTRRNRYRGIVSAYGRSPALPSCQALTCRGQGRPAETAGQQVRVSGARGSGCGCARPPSSQRPLTLTLLNLSLDNPRGGWAVCPPGTVLTARGPLMPWQRQGPRHSGILGRPALSLAPHLHIT